MLVFRGVCLLCWLQVCEDFKSPWRGFPKSWSWQFRLFVFSEAFLTDFKAPLPKNHHTKKNKKMHCKDRQCFCLTLFYPWIHNNVSLKTGQLLSKKGHHRRFGESPKFQCSTYSAEIISQLLQQQHNNNVSKYSFELHSQHLTTTFLNLNIAPSLIMLSLSQGPPLTRRMNLQKHPGFEGLLGDGVMLVPCFAIDDVNESVWF